jgi:hypothetical protein
MLAGKETTLRLSAVAALAALDNQVRKVYGEVI